MKNTALVITSIADQSHPVLNKFAQVCKSKDIPFIVIGDKKSPLEFNLDGCDFYSVERQLKMNFSLVEKLPFKHYARKNLGYLQAIATGAEIIIETDDDNLPYDSFWETRNSTLNARVPETNDWVNVYQYFTKNKIWPRGFDIEKIMDTIPSVSPLAEVYCPIQQGLADQNPDVDAIFRLAFSLPFDFDKSDTIVLNNGAICPFNSQNTTWFSEAFPLLYLPSYCSFRMTDIWRSFIAQRISWEYGWSLAFHNSTVWQERNDHSLLKDFEDEVSGYLNNAKIVKALKETSLSNKMENIGENLITCYKTMIDLGVVDAKELELIDAWNKDINNKLN